MSTPGPHPQRSLPQLRKSLRRWRTAALISACLVVLSGGIVYECRRSEALHWMWYGLGGGGVVLYSARFVAQVVEYRRTKKQIREMGVPP